MAVGEPVASLKKWVPPGVCPHTFHTFQNLLNQQQQQLQLELELASFIWEQANGHLNYYCSGSLQITIGMGIYFVLHLLSQLLG